MKLSGQMQKIIWALAMSALAGLTYLGFRAYLSPSALIDFANRMFVC